MNDLNTGMTKASSPPHTPDNSVKNDKKKKSIIPKIFGKSSNRGGSNEDVSGSDSDGVSADDHKKLEPRGKEFVEPSPNTGKKFSGRKESSPDIEGLNLSNFEQSLTPETEIKEFRLSVATWNVGGKAPDCGINLEEFLQVEGCSDIYICGFQEIVPLSAGNVLVIEDNEPAAKWLALINQALNRSQHDILCSGELSPKSKVSGNNNNHHNKDSRTHNLFHKPSLKVLSRNLRADSSILKMCNCPLEYQTKERCRGRKVSESMIKVDSSSADQDGQEINASDQLCLTNFPTSPLTYNLIATKQMVGLFLSIWARKELVPYIAHLRISTIGRGIMGCLGNKGCISVSMSLHRTTFCFVCSHLASGEKEGDEIKRNADVVEILKSTQFTKICKHSKRPAPERIEDHDRVIWLGDLNYRVALSYEETKVLLEDNDWDTLLEKDQLNLEREAGRVFNGFKEGKIMFAPTYKYSQNSDSYAGENAKSKKKRRTPAWCDRILWRGNGIEQLSYIRVESRFSDHRPVCALFAVEVEMRNRNVNRFRKGYSYAAARLEYDECTPQRHSFYGV
ncbi:hypothetical protein K2173_005303 [Erythroxylum novogranatense]|uniref:Inositol polyphosphate-related phosphatase domain-containing protein n=1 Tax=Erythroxylum novogranatense TaxID=1862640 RepID=A0AAV8TTZ6_9ROSI|nr:hypothetical protein K2173_005303 [Erythroxylum novogranatense]